jgi:CheY-like chemotaxis protein
MRNADASTSKQEPNTMAVEHGDTAARQQANSSLQVAGASAAEVMAEQQVLSVRIAVAEDEPDIRKTFCKLLELMGHRVVYSVGNGAELLEKGLDGQVDVVFVDLDMPVMDGLAAAEEVERKGIPVILVSGHPEADSVVIDQEPVVTRITKPATIEDVQSAIRQAVAARNRKPR